MKNKLKLAAICQLLSAICLSASAQGTAFTYQGRLNDGVNPAAGIYDLRFTIYDSTNNPGVVVAGPLTNSATAVTNGLFTVTLDFSNVFPGTDRFLEIGVRTNGGSVFLTLSPRQQLTSTPYAIRSVEAMRVPSNAITSVMLVDGAVTSAKIATGAVSQLGAPDGSPLDAVVVDNSGRVGVGTNAPQDRLHVAGGNLLLGTGASVMKQDSNGVARSVLLYDVSDNLQLLAPPDHDLSLRTGTGGFTSVRATLTAAGRLGIGTTTPDALLHIQSGDNASGAVITASNLQLERTADNWLSFMSPANRLGGLAFGRPGSTSAELFHGAILYNESTLPDAMQFRTGGNLTRMTITSSGAIGIGVTNPSRELEVQNSGATEIGIKSTDTGGHLWTVQSSGITGSPNLDASFQIIDRTLNVARLLIRTNGDVGIGTSAPTGKLHVVDAVGGDDSVVLPNSSIGAVEIADEPGCSSKVRSSGDAPVTAIFPTPPSSVFSNSITVPTAGYVLAIATINAQVTATGAALCRWGLTTNPTNIPSDAMTLVEYQPSSPGGSWGMPVTLHRVFTVSAGTTTVHIMAQEIAASWEFNNVQLSLVFIPTAYGAVAAAAKTGPLVASTVVPLFGNLSDEANIFTSDRNLKEKFQLVDAKFQLNKVCSLPISQWNYLGHDQRHVGPMAQDFHAAFGLNGDDDKHIATVDANGVALAAIQGLNQKVEQKEAEITELKQKNESLEKRLDALEKIIRNQKPN
jgi:hypothetical protein